MNKEKQLVNNCLNKKPNAQKELYKRYASRMFGICLHYSRNKMEAEDILQEGFIRVFTKLKTFGYAGSLEGWIRKIMVNSAINYSKKYNSYYQEVDIENIARDDFKIVENEAISNLTEEEMVKFIQELPSGKRIVFSLYVYEGFSHKDIAEKLDISISTSKTQLAKAKAILRNKLEKIQKSTYESAI